MLFKIKLNERAMDSSDLKEEQKAFGIVKKWLQICKWTGVVEFLIDLVCEIPP